jgi:hypothetical protein
MKNIYKKAFCRRELAVLAAKPWPGFPAWWAPGIAGQFAAFRPDAAFCLIQTG